MITININGLTLCHKGSGGVSHNTMPDVCKTPPFGVPVAYENEAYSSDLVKGTTSIFADGGNMIANMGSQFARSVLDEAGSMGGRDIGDEQSGNRVDIAFGSMCFLRENRRVA
nr:Putative transmembrane protein [Salmonella sp. NCTC 7297]